MVRGFGGERRWRAVGGHRRSPSWLGLSANSGFLGVGRAGGLRRGRREYVPVGSGAPSMALTPLRSPPARPRTGSCAASHGRQNKKSKAEAGRCALQCLISDVPWLPASGRHYRRASTHGVDLPQIAEIWRGWGGGGQQDRWRHGWRHRAPTGEGALFAKHCFASARTPSRQRLGRTAERGLRRVLLAPTTPPSHGNPAFAWAVAVAVAVAGAVAIALASAGAGRRPAKAHPPLPVQCRARFPTTVPRT